ncbi:MAG: hypothetical protein ACI9YB_003502 [Halioglobus sp.]|jgi:hypothetical protein
MKPWFLTWFSGFFAFIAFLHVFRMSLQLDLMVEGVEIPMMWSAVVIAVSIIISVALLLAAAQTCNQEVKDVVPPETPSVVEDKPVVDRGYGSDNFEGEDSISSADSGMNEE